MKKFLLDFKRFCMRGNILDMAVGVMIGGAFTAIVTSLVNDLLMPVIGLLTGGLDFSGLFFSLDGTSYATLEAAKAAGAATFNYGAFLQAILNFLIMAFCIFSLIKAMSRFMPKKEESTKKDPHLCPYCRQTIADEATRCPHCTSLLSQGEAPDAQE